MKSNYALYIEERENKEIIENEKGFATFFVNKDQCYIVDVFVKKEFRKQGIASDFIDKISTIAKERNCTYILGSACTTTNGVSESIKWMLGIDFKISNTHGTMIYLTKDI